MPQHHLVKNLAACHAHKGAIFFRVAVGLCSLDIAVVEGQARLSGHFLHRGSGRLRSLGMILSGADGGLLCCSQER